jgi:hypothetical protein
MSRDATTFLYSAVAGFLGAITYLIRLELQYAEAQRARRVEDARMRYTAENGNNG